MQRPVTPKDKPVALDRPAHRLHSYTFVSFVIT